MFTREMRAALRADAEKLRQLTGEDHAVAFLCDNCGDPVEDDAGGSYCGCCREMGCGQNPG